MIDDARQGFRRIIRRSGSNRRVTRLTSAVMAATTLAACISLAPPAVASSADRLRDALMSAHSASCKPLRSDPRLEQAAEDINRQTDKWLDFKGRIAPVDDALPTVKDLGYGGSKVRLLQGANTTEALAIKALLIEGYLAIPDCSYTDYGVSVLQNRTTNYFLAAAILGA